MHSDEITNMLKQDFEALSATFKQDSFSRRLLFRLGSQQRLRLGVVGVAGGLGAAFAAAQFTNLRELLDAHLSSSTLVFMSDPVTVQITGALVLGACALLTAFVLRKDA